MPCQRIFGKKWEYKQVNKKSKQASQKNSVVPVFIISLLPSRHYIPDVWSNLVHCQCIEIHISGKVKRQRETPEDFDIDFPETEIPG